MEPITAVLSDGKPHELRLTFGDIIKAEDAGGFDIWPMAAGVTAKKATLRLGFAATLHENPKRTFEQFCELVTDWDAFGRLEVALMAALERFLPENQRQILRVIRAGMQDGGETSGADASPKPEFTSGSTDPSSIN